MGVDGRTELNSILKEQDGNAWSGLLWNWTEVENGHFEHNNETVYSSKYRAFFD